MPVSDQSLSVRRDVALGGFGLALPFILGGIAVWYLLLGR